MRKVLLIAALLLAGATASFAQFHLGGGYYGELRGSTYKAQNTKYSSRGWLNGFYVGGSYNIALSDIGLGLAPGAYFSFVGGFDWLEPIHFADIWGWDWGYVHRTAIDLPVHVTYSHELGPGTIFGYAGPSFNVGLGYKCRVNNWDDGEGNYSRTIFNYYKRSDKVADLGWYRRLDCKIGFGAGYRWEHLAAEVGWEFGVINQFSRYYRQDYEIPNKAKSHIHSFHFGVAYVF